MARAELEGLCDDRSLEIFLLWHSFGGLTRGLSIGDIVTMPAWLRKDFIYLSKTMGRLRKETRAMEKLKEGVSYAAKSSSQSKSKFTPTSKAGRFRRRR